MKQENTSHSASIKILRHSQNDNAKQLLYGWSLQRDLFACYQLKIHPLNLLNDQFKIKCHNIQCNTFTLVYQVEWASAQNEVCTCSTHVCTCSTGTCMLPVIHALLYACINHRTVPGMFCQLAKLGQQHFYCKKSQIRKNLTKMSFGTIFKKRLEIAPLLRGFPNPENYIAR